MNISKKISKLLVYLVSAIAVFYSSSYAMEQMSPSSGKHLPQAEEWHQIISMKVPFGREQLDVYKNIYDQHEKKYGASTESFGLHIDGLSVPFKWLYANAYQRLSVYENENPQILEKIGKRPTVVLEQLYLEHIQDPSKALSVELFKSYVLDVVDFLDLCFHYSNSYLVKNSVDNIFLKKNRLSAYRFFSPIFLKKQGVSVSSINYAFFGKGPLLEAVEVGPNRNAHEGLYSQTNRRFILNHDMLHAGDAYRFLKEGNPKVYAAFQAFSTRIEALSENKAAQSYLGLGLFLFGHEYVTQIYEHYQINSLSTILTEAVAAGFYSINNDLEGCLHVREEEYVVLFKDSLEGMAQVLTKYPPVGKEESTYRSIQTLLQPQNRVQLRLSSGLNVLLQDFQAGFMDAAEFLIKEIDSELAWCP